MLKIILLGEPKSTGHIYRTTCRGNFASVYMNKEGKELKESYCWQAIAQNKRRPLITEPIEVTIALFFGTKRKADVDNFNKLVLDSLTGIVWLDDSQIQKLTI